MNVYDKLLVCLTLLLVLYAQAKDEARRFEQKLTISHFGKAVIYGCFASFWVAVYVYTLGWWYILKVGGITLLERMAFFDFILNKIRHKTFFYNGERTTGSEIDKEENKLPFWALVTLKIVYVIGFIIAVIFIK